MKHLSCWFLFPYGICHFYIKNQVTTTHNINTVYMNGITKVLEFDNINNML
jgi:hypothetical protein